MKNKLVFEISAGLFHKLDEFCKEELKLNTEVIGYPRSSKANELVAYANKEDTKAALKRIYNWFLVQKDTCLDFVLKLKINGEEVDFDCSSFDSLFRKIAKS